MAQNDANQLMQALKCIFNASTPNSTRIQASRVIEDFKENHENPSVTGFYIAKNSQLYNEQSFGLQLVEHTIRYKWLKLQPAARCIIKDECVAFIQAQNTTILSHSCTLVNQALARCMCEMMKNEWPQMWSDLMATCGQLVSMGLTQSQIVLLMWCQLIEDVVLFHNVRVASRRKDLQNAITLVTPDLIEIIDKCLLLPSADPKAQMIIGNALELFETLIDWMPSAKLGKDYDIVSRMTQLLGQCSSKELALKLAICLSECSQRKGSNEDRKPAYVLLEPISLNLLLTAALQLRDAQFEVDGYRVLKQIAAILHNLAVQIAFMMSEKGRLKDFPTTFDVFLDTCVDLLKYPSIAVRVELINVLNCLVKIDKFEDCDGFKKSQAKIIHSCVEILPRIGFPSKDDHPVCATSVEDFDCDTEFFSEFYKLRTLVTTFLKSVTIVTPLVVYAELKSLFQRVLPDPNSVSEIEWEVLLKFVDAVVPELEKCKVATLASEIPGELEEIVKFMLKDLVTLQAKVENVNKVDHLMSCLSNFLCNFDVFSTTIIFQSLNELLKICTLSSPDEKPQTANSFRSVRNHACFAFTRLALEKPKLLLPHFNFLKARALDPATNLSRTQKCYMVEMLCSLSNHIDGDGGTNQKEFVDEILNSIRSFFTGVEILKALESPELFAKFVGLCDPAVPSVDGIATDVFVQRKRRLLAYSELLSVLVRRIKSPEQNHVAFEGCCTFLDQIFMLMRCLNGIYSYSCCKTFHSDFGVAVLDVQSQDKLCIVGQVPHVESDKMFPKVTPCDFARSFLWELSEHNYIVAGTFCSAFGPKFLTLPKTPAYFTHAIATQLDEVTDFRRRMLLRFTLKPFLFSLAKMTSSSSDTSHVLPVLGTIFSHYQRVITKRWEKVCERLSGASNENTDGEDATMNEIFEEQLLRMLTRDMITCILSFFYQKSVSSTAGNWEGPPVFSEVGEENAASGGKLELSAFTRALLGDQSCCTSLSLLLIGTLTWPDSNSLLKVITCFLPLIRQLKSLNLMDSETAYHFMYKVLCAFQTHGGEETLIGPLLTLATRVYQFLVPDFPNIRNLLMQVPDVKETDVAHFEKTFTMPEKVRKEKLRAIVKGIIGQPVAMQFSRKVRLRQLPPILKPTKPNTVVQTDFGIASLFGGSECL